MQIKCCLCGRMIEISKVHKDYQRLANDPGEKYICDQCLNKVQLEARETQKPSKSI